MYIKALAGNIAKVKAGAIIVGCFEKKGPEGDAAAVDKALGGAISQLIKQGEIKGKAGEVTLLHSLGRLPAERIAVIGLGKKAELTADRVRAAAAGAGRWLRGKGVSSLAAGVLGAGVNGITPDSAAQAVTEGALLGLYTFRRYITEKGSGFKDIKRLRLVGREKARLEKAIARGKIMAEAAIWARDLVNEPGNNMTPSHMAGAARALAEDCGLEAEVWGREQMAAAGMGALLGVAQGSQQPPQFIILRYKGSEADRLDVALVGKGITFDSGGISIKPSEGMAEMRGDMAGGAAVLAAMAAIARLQPGINVTALVPATENLPSGTALKPGDIIKAINGQTIEVLNTDAEGRLILADALGYAVKQKARAIVDVATLTGACRVALGTLCTGAFTNNQALANKLIAAGNGAGERVWQLPMYPEYREYLKSDVADIKNIGNRYGGAITAAKFLEDFVAKTPWVHLDIAGTSESDKDKGYLVKGATGVPVRLLVEFVLALAGGRQSRR